MLNQDIHHVEDAIDALRRGRVVVIIHGETAFHVCAVDFLSVDQIKEGSSLLLSYRRAETLKITADGRAAGEKAVQLVIPEGTPLQRLCWIQASADPVQDLASPLKGPFIPKAFNTTESEIAQAGLKLAQRARLLPALLIQPGDQSVRSLMESHCQASVSGLQSENALPLHPRALCQVTAQQILSYDERQAQALYIVARAPLPLQEAETCEILAFRSHDGAFEHLALRVGDPEVHTPILVRLHSECFTGDFLQSLKCDCGSQLRGAVARLAQEPGGGLLLYLAQEGRGIGLINKIRAYALQNQGFDTVDANLRLGFESDLRNFEPAAQMLRLMHYENIRLLTNNPDKVAGLEACGIHVVEQISHQFPDNPHNRHYLQTKRERSGHWIDKI